MLGKERDDDDEAKPFSSSLLDLLKGTAAPTSTSRLLAADATHKINFA